MHGEGSLSCNADKVSQEIKVVWSKLLPDTNILTNVDFLYR